MAPSNKGDRPVAFEVAAVELALAKTSIKTGRQARTGDDKTVPIYKKAWTSLTRQAITAFKPLSQDRLFDKRYRIDFHLECIGNEASKRYGDEISPPVVHREPIG